MASETGNETNKAPEKPAAADGIIPGKPRVAGLPTPPGKPPEPAKAKRRNTKPVHRLVVQNLMLLEQNANAAMQQSLQDGAELAGIELSKDGGKTGWQFDREKLEFYEEVDS